MLLCSYDKSKQLIRNVIKGVYRKSLISCYDDCLNRNDNIHIDKNIKSDLHWDSMESLHEMMVEKAYICVLEFQNKICINFMMTISRDLIASI